MLVVELLSNTEKCKNIGGYIEGNYCILRDGWLKPVPGLPKRLEGKKITVMMSPKESMDKLGVVGRGKGDWNCWLIWKIPIDNFSNMDDASYKNLRKNYFIRLNNRAVHKKRTVEEKEERKRYANEYRREHKDTMDEYKEQHMHEMFDFSSFKLIRKQVEKKRKQHRKWTEQHPEKNKEYHNSSRKKRESMTPKELEEYHQKKEEYQRARIEKLKKKYPIENIMKKIN